MTDTNRHLAIVNYVIRGDGAKALPEDLIKRILAETWEIQDGYGEPGFTPPQGWDWSGIRDSSEEAIRDMAACVLRLLLKPPLPVDWFYWVIATKNHGQVIIHAPSIDYAVARLAEQGVDPEDVITHMGCQIPPRLEGPPTSCPITWGFDRNHEPDSELERAFTGTPERCPHCGSQDFYKDNDPRFEGDEIIAEHECADCGLVARETFTRACVEFDNVPEPDDQDEPDNDLEDEPLDDEEIADYRAAWQEDPNYCPRCRDTLRDGERVGSHVCRGCGLLIETNTPDNLTHFADS
jgi:predicted RNA-binding Zn-ribbon protein involved in translation (DUF1610 family)